MDHWVVAGQPPQIPAEYLRYTETEEQDPQAMPPLGWSAEPRAEGSEDSESVESERRRNPWGVDSDDLVTRFELYGYWEGSEESEEPEPEESERPEPNTGVPSWFLGAPESYTGVPTMFERYGVHTDELPTYRELCRDQGTYGLRISIIN